jgi:hydrogenase expression/formation protein HypD
MNNAIDNQELSERLIKNIKNMKFDRNINIMEVCGSHTMAIAKYGLKGILPEGIKLLSGPGCPVCVTASSRIDAIYRLAMGKKVVIATYGDMIRVPGSSPDISLRIAKSFGARIKIVYSAEDALDYAKKYPDEEVVFIGIGFETTSPTAALIIKDAKRENIKNISILSLHKVVEPVMRFLLEQPDIKLDGFLCPGHVATIIGAKGFDFISRDYGKVGIITGFEPLDIIEALYMILTKLKKGESSIENQYARCVNYLGNKAAVNVIKEVFEPCDDVWRGIGNITNSGLKIREEYRNWDAAAKFDLTYEEEKPTACKCGEVLKGKISPYQCPLFKKICNPDNPVGPCMVSSEGSCAAAYKYK